jgi:hypothetical protein
MALILGLLDAAMRAWRTPRARPALAHAPRPTACALAPSPQLRFLEDLVARLSAEVSRRALSPERATAAALSLAGAGDAAAPVAMGAAPPLPASPAPPAPPPPAPPPPAPGAPTAPPPADVLTLLTTDALGIAAVLRDQVRQGRSRPPLAGLHFPRMTLTSATTALL